MITVEVVSINGGAPAQPISARIDERGGTIGRLPDNALVLADETRAVSRVHAAISFKDGVFSVTDKAVNPVKVNGVALGKDRSVALSDGDQLAIGPYDLVVRMAKAAVRAPVPAAPLPVKAAPGIEQRATPPAVAAPPALPDDDPFADLLGPGFTPSAAPVVAPPPAPAQLAKPAASAFDQFDFGSPASVPPPPSARVAPPPGGLLPMDFDPFASMSKPAPTPDQSARDVFPEDDAFGPLSAEPPAPGAGSLDALFGLSSSSSSDPFASSFGASGADTALPEESDLGALLGPPKSVAAAPVSNHVPEINSAFALPKPSRPPSPPRAEPALEKPLIAPLPPVAAPPIPEPPAPAPSAAQPLPTPVAARPATAAPAPAFEGDATSAALLAALLEGLGTPDLRIAGGLTPDNMRKLGALLLESTRGAQALLVARGMLKRELRAEVTMIASGRNNPLKFSPDAVMALRYMLGTSMPGFMGAEEAMRDAFDDLRAHEFGFIAGMRAALTGVLGRFAPELIETRLSEKGMLDSVLPANRRAKLWDAFSALYKQLMHDAEEDFHGVFGREFLRAYEESIKSLGRGQNRPKL